jgi:two-component system chemotaxis response regulator CheY
MLNIEYGSIYPVNESIVTKPVIFGAYSPPIKKVKTTYKREVLIIEDSAAVSLIFQKFLKSLGYENIYTCSTGKKGIKIFKELSDSSNTPIVFLDYSLPDMIGDEIMEELFDIDPDAKIIIESANERNDDVIKEILRHGAYDFIEKPIRLENIRNITKVIEQEERIIDDKPDYSFDVKW